MDLCIASHLLIGIIIYLHFDCVLSLRLTRVDVPSSVIMGDPVWLNCSYELENDELYSIKWYNSNGEFYRWVPKDIPPGQKYDSRGIYLDLSKSSYGNVYLSMTDLHTDGTYRCEVSAEAPSFQTVRKEKELRVYSLPKEGPSITGIKSQQYGIGDLVNVTCRTGPSKVIIALAIQQCFLFYEPQSTLSWSINGETALKSYLNNIPVPKRSDGLQESALQLQFNAERHQFIGGIIKLRCTSVISQAYSMSSEEIIVSDHSKASHTHSVHESEGPVISGGRPTYNVGDVINLTCTSAKSYPAPELKFYINEKEARPEYLREYPKVHLGDGTEVSSLGLVLKVEPTHFGGSSTSKRRTHYAGKDNQQIRLKCTATLQKVIDTSSRETIIGSSQQSSGLHIAENKAVNLNRGQSLLSTQIILLLICFYTTVWYSRS